MKCESCIIKKECKLYHSFLQLQCKIHKYNTKLTRLEIKLNKCKGFEKW